MIREVNKWDKIEIAFKLCYFFLALISFNSFCARQWYLSYMSYAVVVIGAVVLLWRVSHIRDYLNSKIWLLLAFVVSYIFGSINALEYGFMENLQGVIWMCLQYFAVFAFDVTSDSDVRDYEFSLITKFFLAYTGLMAAIGLFLMMIKYSSYEIVDDYYVIAAGFNFNRLWGCYNDPNYGAILAIVSIYLSFYYLRTVTDLKIKMLLYLNLFCEYLYICYSDSRTGQVALFFSSVVLIYGALVKNFNDIKWLNFKGAKNVLVCFVISVLAASVVLGGVFTLQRLSSIAQMKITEQALIEEGVTGEELEAAVDKNRIGREEDEINDGDTSNNRFAIWAFGLDVFEDNPITGISFRNIREYAVDVMADEFIKQGEFDSMHNFLVDILVSQGAIGFVIVLVLIVVVVVNLWKYGFVTEGKDYVDFVYALACIAAIFVSMMFYSETFYMNTGGAFIFWYLLGYIVNYRCLLYSNSND